MWLLTYKRKSTEIQIIERTGFIVKECGLSLEYKVLGWKEKWEAGYEFAVKNSAP